jgi:hypothetical protein
MEAVARDGERKPAAGITCEEPFEAEAVVLSKICFAPRIASNRRLLGISSRSGLAGFVRLAQRELVCFGAEPPEAM